MEKKKNKALHPLLIPLALILAAAVHAKSSLAESNSSDYGSARQEILNTPNLNPVTKKPVSFNVHILPWRKAPKATLAERMQSALNSPPPGEDYALPTSPAFPEFSVSEKNGMAISLKVKLQSKPEKEQSVLLIGCSYENKDQYFREILFYSDHGADILAPGKVSVFQQVFDHADVLCTENPATAQQSVQPALNTSPSEVTKESSAQASSNSNPDQSTEQPNGPVSGSLYYGSTQLNLQTGVTKERYKFPNLRAGSATFSPDGTRMLEMNKECEPHSISPSRWSADCIFIRDNNGNELAYITTDATIRQAQVSFDNRYVAMKVTYFGDIDRGYTQLLIADARDGKLLTKQHSPQLERSIAEFQWQRDGSIVYTRGKSRTGRTTQWWKISNPLSGGPGSDFKIADTDQLKLVAPTKGSLGTFDVSPNGQSIVFTWGYKGNLRLPGNVLYLLELKTHKAVLFAASRLISSVSRPIFSPDGKWVIAGTSRIPSLTSEFIYRGTQAYMDVYNGLPAAAVAMRVSAAPHGIVVDGRLESEDMYFIRFRCGGTCKDKDKTYNFLGFKAWTAWTP